MLPQLGPQVASGEAWSAYKQPFTGVYVCACESVCIVCKQHILKVWTLVSPNHMADSNPCRCLVYVDHYQVPPSTSTG